MLESWIWPLASVIIVSLFSLVGLLTLSVSDKTLSRVVLFLVSFSAGALLGDAFMHLVPEAAEAAGFTLDLSLYLLSGIGVSFILEKFVCWRHCHISTSPEHPHPVGLMNLFGDSLHNFIDGLVIGGSYLAGMPVGIATTVAVILHEIPQEIGDYGVLIYAGFSRRKAIYYNFLTALTAILGVVFSMLLAPLSTWLVHFLLPFGAGAFIYVACADLIPQLQKVQSVGLWDSAMQLAALFLGVCVMLAMKLWLA